MINQQQTEQFNEIFNGLADTLDISQAEHDAAVTSYEFVGNWLAAEASLLSPYKPEILPQGSFLLGTMIKAVQETDELDVDLVCKLTGKKNLWTQYHLKQVVGDRLNQHGTLKRLLDKEGRRCWTLRYSEGTKFHLDILPAIVGVGFNVLLEKSLSARELDKAEELAIRITDRHTTNYLTETNPHLWLKSNPFGYAAWFKQQASLDLFKALSLREAVQPVPKYTAKKLPLQRVVQILKRHRDIMFNGDEDKPISIILTTLAAKAYLKQTSVTNALVSIIERMPTFIEERYDPTLGRYIKWIPNPVNPEENFADKWPANPKKEANFYKWLSKVKADITNVLLQKGLHRINEALVPSFGKQIVNKAFSNIGEAARALREKGNMRMAETTGILSNIGRTQVLHHNNFGNGE